MTEQWQAARILRRHPTWTWERISEEMLRRGAKRWGEGGPST